MNVSVGELEATFKLRDEFSEKIRGLGATLDKVGKGISNFGTALTVGVTAPLVAIGGAAIKAGMDAVESENLFAVSFGSMADKARAWSEQTSDALGLNAYELRRNSALIFGMSETMGLSQDAAFGMATGMSELANDMASFFNISSEEAFAKLKAGIVGEAEPLKALSILVDEATSKQAAYTHGIAKYGEELTQQQKVQARWAAILDQTKKVQGDLANTIDSPTNKLRSMRSRIEEASISLGMAMLPALESVTKFLDRMVPKIEAAVKWFADLPEPTRNWAIGLAAVAAAAGPVLFALGTMVSSVGSLTVAVGVLKVALLGLNLTPLGLAFTAAGAAALVLQHTVRDSLKPMNAQAQAAADNAIIQRAFASATEFSAEEQKELAAAIERTSQKVGDQSPRLTGAGESWGGLRISVEDAKEGLKKVAAPLKDVNEKLSAMIDTLTGRGLVNELALMDAAIVGAARSGGIASKQFFDLGKKLQDLEDEGGKLSAQQQGIARSYTLLQIATGAYTLAVGTQAQSVTALSSRLGSLHQTTMQPLITTWQVGVQRLAALGSEMKRLTDAPPLFSEAQLAAQRAWVSGLDVAKNITADIGHAMTGAGRIIMSVRGQAIGIVQQYVGSARDAAAAMAAWSGVATIGIGTAISLFTAGLQRVREWRAEVVSLQEQISRLGATPLPLAEILAKLPGVTGLARTAVELLRKQLEGLTAAQNALNDAMSRAGLSLDDIGTDAEKAAKRLAKFLDDAKRLIQAGFSIEQVVRGNNDALNDLLKHAIQTGQKLPASMRPYLEELIRSGGLTDELKRKLLGLADPVPWQEMEAAAARYGLSIDALGVQFEQAKLDDAIKQIVKDWELLSKNGADVGAVMAAMKDEVQALITKALKLGLTIPESMRPLIEAMIEAGELTDENGDKLTDLTRLKFAEDLESDFDKLIRKLDEFIERLVRAGGALGDWPDPGDAFPPLPPVIDEPANPTIPPSEDPHGAMASIVKKASTLMKSAASAGIPMSGAIAPRAKPSLDPLARFNRQPAASIMIDARGALFPDRASLKDFARILMPHLPDGATLYVSR